MSDMQEAKKILRLLVYQLKRQPEAVKVATVLDVLGYAEKTICDLEQMAAREAMNANIYRQLYYASIKEINKGRKNGSRKNGGNDPKWKI